MLFTRFKDDIPADEELLLIANPFDYKLCYGYMYKGKLYTSERWENGHCVYAIGFGLDRHLECNPNLSYLVLGEMTVKPKELNGQAISIFKRTISTRNH